MLHAYADLLPGATRIGLDEDIAQAQVTRRLRGGLRVHGKYCGPNWTAGMDKEAKLVTDQQFNAVPPTDALDAGCKEHDYRCGHHDPIGQCTKEDDTRLINVAQSVRKNKKQSTKLRAKATAVEQAMRMARMTRKN